MGSRIRELNGTWQSPSQWNLKQMCLRIKSLSLSLVGKVTAYYLPADLFGMSGSFEHRTFNVRKATTTSTYMHVQRAEEFCGNICTIFM